MVPSGFMFLKEQSPGVFLLDVVPLLIITKALIILLNVLHFKRCSEFQKVVWKKVARKVAFLH